MCLSFQKHENEFDDSVVLRELYKFISQYFTEVSHGRRGQYGTLQDSQSPVTFNSATFSIFLLQIKEKMQKNGAPSELMEQLHHVRNLFDGLKGCSWN